MVLNALYRFERRLRPREGWLSFLLLVLVTGVFVYGVLDVGWVAEDSVIIPAAAVGLLLGMVLAKRPSPAWLAWLLITLYGLLIVALTLGKLWPPLDLLLYDWPALRLYWLENGAFSIERLLTWYTAVSVGGRSNETILFAIIMGLIVWFLAAYLGWSAYRQRQPLLGLTLMGLLIAFNGYYGAGAIEWVALFVGLAVLATAVFHFAHLEWGWENRLVDYSSQIKLELLLYAAGIGAVLLFLSFLVPIFRVNPLLSLILGNETVAALEETLDRAFGGVDLPRELLVAPGQAGGRGILPRAFLVGNAPELQKIVMMTATAELLDGPPGVALHDVRHWRALSYEVYTGRGWTLSDEEARPYRAQAPIPAKTVAAQMQIAQSVHWRYDTRATRYSLGRPLLVDHNVNTLWRDDLDLVRVMGLDEIQYEIVSSYSAATAEQLREAQTAAVDPALMRRYTQLPDTVPRRVFDLAQEVAGDQPTPYDKALALERFLRQYDYSLEVPFPPAGSDVVDFFLFDLQEGYCDYYASSMVVMARSLGLPARLASGFLAQGADEEGQQTIRQINGHAWAELYFEGYGWVEFEPTAAFVSPHDPSQQGNFIERLPDRPQVSTEPLPIPEEEAPRQPVSWTTILFWLVAVAVPAFVIWRLIDSRRFAKDGVRKAYGHLQEQATKIGQPPSVDQTPYEFNEDLQERLAGYEERSRLRKYAGQVRDPAEELTNLFVERQYSADPPDETARARELWQRLRRPLWRLRLGRFGSRKE